MHRYFTGMKQLFFFWSFIFFGLFGYSQNDFQNFQTLSVDEGLSQNSVYGMYQDHRGFLWIATADGLNRYDGKRIKKYKNSLSTAEPYNSNYIRGNIAEDANENLWYYTENGLYQYNRRADRIEKKYYPKQVHLGRVDFKVLFVDHEMVWLFNPAAGFASYSIESGRVTLFPVSVQSDYANYIPRDARWVGNFIWYGIERNDGLYRFNIHTHATDHFFGTEEIAFIRFVTGGYYKVGFSSIQYYDSIKGTTEILPIQFKKSKQPSIVSLVKDDNYNVWIATRKEGLWRYNTQTKQTTVFQNQIYNYASIPTNSLTGLLMDRNKNLWISTEGAGVCRIDTQPTMFNTSIISQQQILKKNLFVRAIAEDSKQNIWVASLQNPIYELNPSTGQIRPVPLLNRLKIMDASVILFDSKKNCWVGHDKYISKIDSTGIRLAQYEFSSPLPVQFNKLLELKDGRIMVAWSGGLTGITPMNNPTEKFLIEKNWTNEVQEGRDGTLWAGNKNTGLHQYTRAGERYELKNIFFDNLDVKSIHADKKIPGIIWLATDLGLVRFDYGTKQSKILTEDNGMSSSYVYGILEDTNDRLWCSTNAGISCYNKKTNTFVNYTNKDGLQSNEFNSGAFYQGVSGNFYFGGVKGLNWFNPQAVDADSASTPGMITDMAVSDHSVNDSILVKNKIELPYFKNDISIHFSVLDFTKPESNKIKFQLIGWDKKPQTTYELHADYKNLLPGNYTLVYSASTYNHHWSSNQYFTITIQAPFWQRWWFYVPLLGLAVATVAMIVAYLIRQRYRLKIYNLEKQNELERERRRISMEMHDDIGAGLTRIALISESAKYQTQKEDLLNQIAQTSREVVHSMNEIIWSLNPDHKTFDQLMSYLRDQLHTLLEPVGINYQIDLPMQGNFKPDHAVMRNLILLLKEGTNNAIKHAKATRIEIIGKQNGPMLEIEIIDNGRGFDTNNYAAGNGLKNVAKRIKEIKGQWEIQSKKDRGTRLLFQITMDGKTYY
ncbi:MAG: hypothetical protein JST69_09950 [Bacteroidetes bacterium]|nr:hypothetical protein [Bacteroidota bacterium]